MSNQAVMARALYDFTGDASLRQLSFKKNDVIKVTNQYENGWWAGELNGKIGYLPSTYIKLEGASSARSPAVAPPAGGRGGAASPSPAKPSPATTKSGGLQTMSGTADASWFQIPFLHSSSERKFHHNHPFIFCYFLSLFEIFQTNLKFVFV